jgi:hypothetical protein
MFLYMEEKLLTEIANILNEEGLKTTYSMATEA